MPDSPVITKDPAAELPYTFDWSHWLGTETIATRVTTVPDGLTRVGSDQTSGTTTTVTVAGGDVGKDYVISDAIVTTPSALKDTRRMIIRIRRR